MAHPHSRQPLAESRAVSQTISSSGPMQSSIIEGVEHLEINRMVVKQTNVQNSSGQTPIDHLRKYCSLDALLDSNERYNPPRCAESTRQGILKNLSTWASSAEKSADIFWLYGAAGAGKTAIAQTCAESLQKAGKLAASFFFSRTTESRNNGATLIPSIVLQLTDSWPSLKAHVEERIRSREVFLFSQSREIQARELFLAPLRSLFDTIVADNGDPLESRPQVIVIDGLDECKEEAIQSDLLRIIAKAIAYVPFPLRFLITSRPELHITQIFDHDPDMQAVNEHVHRFDLSTDAMDAESDLHTFLENQFDEIRNEHPLRRHLPVRLPGFRAIEILVKRSSKHFIYAATSMRYIQSPQDRPDERLKVILDLSPARENPYADLDAIYDFVFASVEDKIQTVHRALGIVHLLSERPEGLFQLSLWPSRRKAIEALLGIEAADFDLLFISLRSLIAVDPDIEIFHLSLFDYLLDSKRSGRFHLDLGHCHCTVAKFIFLIYIKGKQCSQRYFEYFAYHCRLSILDDTLMDYLRSFEGVTNHLLTNVLLVDSPSSDAFYGFLVSTFTILDSLRQTNTTLSGEIHKLHTETMTSRCRTKIKSRPSQSGITSRLVALLQRLLSFGPVLEFGNIDLRSEEEHLELTLRKWQPSTRSLPSKTDGSTCDTNDVLIKREHDMFSSVVEGWSATDGQLDYHSSLVTGEHFSHSYHYGMQHLHHIRPGYIRFEFLLFFTYARYSSASFCTVIRQKDLFPRGVHRNFANSGVVLHSAKEHLEFADLNS